ncbi:MAG: DUF309 domain-containing protein [Synechococcales bacterium]|nr:DUF309 domain-containing protein [Synechococcales bacterium]
MPDPLEPLEPSFPPELWIGIEQFNQGEFYACHNTLEAIWMQAPESDKKFYQGILQMAVSLYHLGNGNWRGAVILMGEGVNRLCSYPEDYAGLDLEHLISQGQDLLETLQQLGEQNYQQLTLVDPSLTTANLIPNASTVQLDKPSTDDWVRSRPIIQKRAIGL